MIMLCILGQANFFSLVLKRLWCEMLDMGKINSHTNFYQKLNMVRSASGHLIFFISITWIIRFLVLYVHISQFLWVILKHVLVCGFLNCIHCKWSLFSLICKNIRLQNWSLKFDSSFGLFYHFILSFISYPSNYWKVYFVQIHFNLTELCN